MNYKINKNPDLFFYNQITGAVMQNEGYCPCAIEKNPNTKCMCKDFREQKESGLCHCQRFYKVANAPIVCLCGSTRFKDEFIQAAKDFTLKGYIVTMPMIFVHGGDVIADAQKEALDELHKSKIANADIIYVINKDGYIGSSTRSEIEFAESLHKQIQYMT